MARSQSAMSQLDARPFNTSRNQPERSSENDVSREEFFLEIVRRNIGWNTTKGICGIEHRSKAVPAGLGIFEQVYPQ